MIDLAIHTLTAVLMINGLLLAMLFWRLNSGPIFRSFVRFFALLALVGAWIFVTELVPALEVRSVRALVARGLLVLATGWLLIDLWRMRL